jgi:metalloprotease
MNTELETNGFSTNSFSRRQLVALASIMGGISIASPLQAQFKIGKVLDAGTKIVKSENISDADLKGMFDQMSIEMDSQNPLASPKDVYGKRIATLSRGLQSYDGLNLDIKAYLVKDVNAFAMANGTIRVFAGLMDKFTDDEIRYVIGHEIGHVKSGHTKERMQAALRAGAARDLAGAAGGTGGRIASGKIGKFMEKVIVAQHSQKNEKEADDYALGFMKAKKYNAAACVSALDKLAGLGGGKDPLPWLSTHPAPDVRAKRMRTALGMA